MNKNIKKEINKISKKLSKDPESPLFARLADLYRESGDVDKAIEICEDGLKYHPYYLTAHIVLSKCYRELGMHDEARKELKRTARILSITGWTKTTWYRIKVDR